MRCAEFPPGFDFGDAFFRLAVTKRDPSVDLEGVRVATGFGDIAADFLDIVAAFRIDGLAVRFEAAELRQPAIAQFGSAAQHRIGHAAEQDRDRLLYRHRVQPGIGNAVPLALVGDDIVGPQGAQHFDLFFRPLAAIVEILAQRFEFDLVPTDADAELGIGIGWNEVEFEALGEDFHNRGKRSEEQVEVLRALWTNDIVTYKGKWHSIPDAGLNPMPVQQPIPILFGGMADPVLRRAAKLGDGWLPQFGGFEADGKTVNAEGRDYIQKIRGYITEAGRDPDTFQIDGRVTLGNRKPEECVAEIEAWRELGATHVSLNTMRAGLSSPDAHIDAMRRFKEELG